MKKIGKASRFNNLFRLQIRLIIIGAVFLEFFIIIFFYSNHFRVEEYKKLQNKLTLEGKAFLFALEGLSVVDFHHANQTREELLKNPAYFQAAGRLKEFAVDFKIDPTLIYTMIRGAEEEYFFILIGNEEYAYRKDDPFSLSPVVKPYFEESFITGEITYPPVYTDQAGKWLTVVIPMIDSSGRVYAIHEPALKIEFVDKVVFDSIVENTIFPGIFLIIGLAAIGVILNRVFKPFNKIVNIFRDSKYASHPDLSSVKATGEFAVLRDTLGYFINEIERADKEVKEILRNIKEGLFLLKPDYTLGEIQSAETSLLIGKKSTSSQNFLDIVKSSVSLDALQGIKDFLELMFKRDVEEELLLDLNPLKEVKFYFPGNDGTFKEKFLDFSFNRIVKERRVDHLMVTIKDVSDAVILSQELEKKEARNKEEMEMFVQLLHINPYLLTNFINETRDATGNINTILKGTKQKEDFISSLSGIFKILHAIKGDASMLELNMISGEAHLLENIVMHLIEKKGLAASDFIDVAIGLERLIIMLDDIEKMIIRLKEFRIEFVSREKDYLKSLLDSVAKLIVKMGSEKGKSVQFLHEDFQVEGFPEKFEKVFKTILTQLVRNAVSHGIESPEERTAKGKPEEGRVALSGSIKEGELVFTLRDDGKGIDIPGLIKRAVEKGVVSAEKAEAMSNKDVVKLIFLTGMSTSENVDMDAGRGVGMDVIRDLVRKTGGKMGLHYKKDAYTMFSFHLPLK